MCHITLRMAIYDVYMHDGCITGLCARVATYGYSCMQYALAMHVSRMSTATAKWGEGEQSGPSWVMSSPTFAKNLGLTLVESTR